MGNSVFAHLIGNQKVKNALEIMLKNDALAHAILIVGEEGLGKEAFSTALIKEFLGGDPASHPDSIILRRLEDEKTGKKKTTINVEQIRQLRDRFSMSSISGDKKTLYIEEADRLQPAAANALLKTLEEPRGNALMVLRASSLEPIMETIRSRCQIIRLHPVPVEEIQTALVKRGLSKPDALQYATLAFGRPGFAIRLIEDSGFRSETEIAASQFIDFAEQRLPGRFNRITELLPKSETDKRNTAELLLNQWESVLRDLLLISTNNSDLIINYQQSDQISLLAKKHKAENWFEALRSLLDVRSAILKNTNPQIALEHFAQKLS